MTKIHCVCYYINDVFQEEYPKNINPQIKNTIDKLITMEHIYFSVLDQDCIICDTPNQIKYCYKFNNNIKVICMTSFNMPSDISNDFVDYVSSRIYEELLDEHLLSSEQLSIELNFYNVMCTYKNSSNNVSTNSENMLKYSIIALLFLGIVFIATQ